MYQTNLRVTCATKAPRRETTRNHQNLELECARSARNVRETICLAKTERERIPTNPVDSGKLARNVRERKALQGVTISRVRRGTVLRGPRNQRV